MTLQGSPRVGILTGPTASGKSAFALSYALKNPKIEIINSDSLLVYRHLNIGTAKPSAEEMAQVPHHLINILDPSEPFTAGEFYRAVHTLIQQIHERDKRVLIVGGTAFYLKALLFGIWQAPGTQKELRLDLEKKTTLELFNTLSKADPKSAEKIGISDRYRLIRAVELIQTSGKTPSQLADEANTKPDPQFVLWIADRASAELELRIKNRTRKMLDAGLIEEFKNVSERYPNCRALQAIGYAQVGAFLRNEKPPGRKLPQGMDGLEGEINLATRQLVKSQRTWFKSFCEKMPDAKKFILEEQGPELETELNRLYSEE